MRSGLPHAHTAVRGHTERVPLVLEHRPARPGYAWRALLRKWRRWAPIHAQVYLMRWQDIPQFGYPPDADWPARRVWGNRLSPLLVLPYGVLEFLTEAWTFRRLRPVRQVFRIAAVGGLYVLVVQAYVAKYRYLDRSAGRAPAGFKPGRFAAEP